MEPVSLDIKYDAYWITPDGLIYGMTGESNNMLHIQIANLLVNDKVIEYNGNLCDIDAYLEECGWCKIHHNNIYFCPYVVYRKDSKIILYLTDKQVNIIVKYLNKFYNRIGRFGFNNIELNTYQFNSMDKFARNKLFSY